MGHSQGIYSHFLHPNKIILEREKGQTKPFKCDILGVSDIIPAANRFGELWTLFTDVNVTDMAARLRAHPPLSGSKKMT